MKQEISPKVAAIVIILALGVAGFFLWYSNRERPRPTHFGLPPQMQKMEDARAGQFKAEPNSGKPIVKPAPKTEKEKRAAEVNGNFQENAPAGQ